MHQTFGGSVGKPPDQIWYEQCARKSGRRKRLPLSASVLTAGTWGGTYADGTNEAVAPATAQGGARSTELFETAVSGEAIPISQQPPHAGPASSSEAESQQQEE
jgi:hypothetical protein